MALKKNRIQIIDAARGFALIAMLLHHLALDFESILGVTNIPIINEPYFEWIHFFFLTVFILISGICSHFSKSNIKRGVIVLICAMVVSLVSFIVMPKAPIYFGILHLFGCCMIIYGLLQKAFEKLQTAIAAPLYLVLFAVYYFFYVTAPRIAIPHLYIFGFPDFAFASADYFPLFPWIFLFMLGTVIGRPIANKRLPQRFYTQKVPILSKIGRHTLIIYILHQPVFMGILLAVRYFITK